MVLPAPLELRVRRAVGPGEDAFEALPGAITLTLVPVPNPPPGHAPIAVRVRSIVCRNEPAGWPADSSYSPRSPDSSGHSRPVREGCPLGQPVPSAWLSPYESWLYRCHMSPFGVLTRSTASSSASESTTGPYDAGRTPRRTRSRKPPSTRSRSHQVPSSSVRANVSFGFVSCSIRS